MKKLTILTLMFISFGCGDMYPKAKIPDVAKEEYLWNLRRDAISAISDSFNTCMRLYNEALLVNDREKAVFYKGQAEAYYKCEKIVWPTYASEYPTPSKE